MKILLILATVLAFDVSSFACETTLKGIRIEITTPEISAEEVVNHFTSLRGITVYSIKESQGVFTVKYRPAADRFILKGTHSGSRYISNSGGDYEVQIAIPMKAHGPAGSIRNSVSWFDGVSATGKVRSDFIYSNPIFKFAGKK